MLKHFVFYFLSIISVFYSEASVLSLRGSYLKPYHNGQFQLAEDTISQIIQSEIPNLDYTRSNEAVWLLLDRATIRFAMGKVPQAVKDYNLAIDALEYYDRAFNCDALKQILWQDESSAYQAPDLEQLLARLYFSFALLHIGDRSNAFALLRNAEEFLQTKEYIYRKLPFAKDYRIPENPLIRYLFAVLLEKKGDISNANIIYRQLHQETVVRPLQASLLVIGHNGNAPYRVSSTAPGSVASSVALEFFLARKGIPTSWSTCTGIPVPALQQWPLSSAAPIFASLDGNRHILDPFFDVHEATQLELEKKLPTIVAKGIARQLLRRSAVGYAQEKNSLFGLVLDIGMLVANSYTRADTRSWTTLPATVDLTRFDVEPGEHTLYIELPPIYPPQQSVEFKIKLKPNDLCIVHIFNIHPGIVQILVPQRFQGESQ